MFLVSAAPGIVNVSLNLQPQLLFGHFVPLRPRDLGIRKGINLLVEVIDPNHEKEIGLLLQKGVEKSMSGIW